MVGWGHIKLGVCGSSLLEILRAGHNFLHSDEFLFTNFVSFTLLFARSRHESQCYHSVGYQTSVVIYGDITCLYTVGQKSI